MPAYRQQQLFVARVHLAWPEVIHDAALQQMDFRAAAGKGAFLLDSFPLQSAGEHF